VTAPPAAAEPGYQRQAVRTFTLTTREAPVYTQCRGNAWIGINDNGYVSARTRVTCETNAWAINAYNALHTGNSLDPIDEAWVSRSNDDYVQATTSGGKATRGRRYCSYGIGDALVGIPVSGSANVCVTAP
jgi:hypothetical protein